MTRVLFSSILVLSLLGLAHGIVYGGDIEPSVVEEFEVEITEGYTTTVDCDQRIVFVNRVYFSKSNEECLGNLALKAWEAISGKQVGPRKRFRLVQITM